MDGGARELTRPAGTRWRQRLELGLYALAVVLGSVLLVGTALNQPYNQNEWEQIKPYGSPDITTAVTGTRQPPLDPLLGSLVQRLVGEGQLEQRLVPVACGVGSLVLMCFLLRRLRLSWIGPLAVVLMATSPLFLRFTAYARPYALPVFLMLLCCVAGSRWLDTGRKRWLMVAAVGALLLPIARVPEPTAFLTVAALVLLLVPVEPTVPLGRKGSLAGVYLLSLLSCGAAMALLLARQQQTKGGHNLVDVNPFRMVGRIPEGAQRLVDQVVPMFADWLPWWPLLLTVAVLALLLPGARRRLGGCWFWTALVLAPLLFLIAMHTVVPLDLRTYQIRFGYFFVVPLVLLVAISSRALGDSVHRFARWVGPLLVATLVVSQLPGTWRVLTENEGADLAQAGDVLAARVPPDALVLYDGPGLTGRWRQPFFAGDRYLGEHTQVVNVSGIAQGWQHVPGDAGRVWLLILDAECVSSVACNLPPADWDGHVPGYRRVERFDHFTLYAPLGDRKGVSGALRAVTALMAAYGPERAVQDAAAAARILVDVGRESAAATLAASVCAQQPEETQRACGRQLGAYGPDAPER